MKSLAITIVMVVAMASSAMATIFDTESMEPERFRLGLDESSGDGSEYEEPGSDEPNTGASTSSGIISDIEKLGEKAARTICTFAVGNVNSKIKIQFMFGIYRLFRHGTPNFNVH